jgi:hypothetical protein
VFLGDPPSRDDLATTLVDGESHLDGKGGAPGTPFQFRSESGLDFLLPGSRVFDADLTGHGALTVTKNMLTHQNISDAGGFTFETYVKRTTATTGAASQTIWSPEGVHMMEITQSGTLQIRMSGSTPAAGQPINTALPLGEWHHLMAVLTVTQPLPPGGDPQEYPVVANYSLLIDGNLLGTTPNSELVLDFLNQEHGIGGNEFGGSNEYFRGQMALTRLSLGRLTIEQSLYLLPPVSNSGDYNGNGFLDAGDYLVWRKSLGTTVNRGTAADGDGSGTIDLPDYIYWRSHFGIPAGSGSQISGSVAVPEPSSGAISLALSFIAAFRQIAQKAAKRWAKSANATTSGRFLSNQEYRRTSCVEFP